MLKAAEFRRALRGSGARSETPPPELDVSSDTAIARMLGDFPDYRDPRIDALWHELMAMPPEKTVRLCRDGGVDILEDNGDRVSFWIDVAVLLLARERGLVR